MLSVVWPGSRVISKGKYPSSHANVLATAPPLRVWGDTLGPTQTSVEAHGIPRHWNWKRSCTFEILDQTKEEQQFLPKVAIAPTKSIDRFEWFLEKAVELGVSEICPILCSNSERRIIKHERSEKILLAAIKQSQRSWMPKLHPLTRFEDFIENTQDTLLITHCREGKKTPLSNKLNRDSWLLIGPEGDFTEVEIDLTLKKPAIEIDLGESRLRTETAGIFALSVMNYLNS